MVNLDDINFKYIVIKEEDIYKYLSAHDMNKLGTICKQIIDNRKNDGKKLNTYIVINTDEPYADEVVEILKRNKHWG